MPAPTCAWQWTAVSRGWPSGSLTPGSRCSTRSLLPKTRERSRHRGAAVSASGDGCLRRRSGPYARSGQPGMTENQLWAVLHETNIAHDGEWIECRLLSSGPRTNPWFQECGNRVIEAGDLVAFDTDLVGPNGYFADISRSFVCPGRGPTAQQQRLYDIAQEQVLVNVDLLRRGRPCASSPTSAGRCPRSTSTTATC